MFDQELFYRLPLQSPLRTHGSLTRVRDAGQFLRLGARGEGVALVQQALIGVAAGMPASTRVSQYVSSKRRLRHVSR